MNNRIGTALTLLAACLGLAACSTTNSLTATPPASQTPVVGTMYQPHIEDDAAYIAKVEHIARMRGIKVQWVNRPQKRTAEQQ